MVKTLVYILLICPCLMGSAFAQAQESLRPNVVLMLADDLANEDLSCYGSERIKTPRIDKLASEGVQLSDYYAGSSICTPARMALLSGSYPARLGWRWGVIGYGYAPKTGMSPSVYTIAEAFRDGGYRTAISGKWHVGTNSMSPEHQGFQSAYYIINSNNMSRDMYRDGEIVKKEWDNRLLSETFAEEAIRIIRQPDEKPFFLYVPWSAPHFPADPHPDWQGKSGEDKSAKFTDVVEELDYRVGQVLDALERAGKSKNTIVIFASDNGRQAGYGQEGQNDKPPYRGVKWQSLEGGQRVPCIVRFPKTIPEGLKSDQLITSMDLFPTLAAACGIKINLPDGAQRLDGINIWTNFTEPKSEPARNVLLYWHGKGQASAIRSGRWKLHFNEDMERAAIPELKDGPVLYDVNADPMETNNLAGKHPEKVAELLTLAKERFTEVYENQLPMGTWPGVEVPKPPLKAGEVWGKWVK